MKPVIYALLIPAFLSALPVIAAENPITEKNWRNHPAIVEVRGIFSEIETGVKKKAFSPSAVSEPAGTAFRDASGRIRKFVTEGGSEDSAYTASQYYDSAATLRFIFVTAGAVNGAQAEYRVYFNAAGKKIWENRTLTTKQGYTFPETWPDDAIARP